LYKDCHTKKFNSYILNYNENIQSQSQVINQSQEDYLSVLSHNMGLLTSKPTQKVISFLKENGKPHSSVLKPLDMNYLFIIEGDLDESSQQQIMKSPLQSIIELNEEKDNLLLDAIFNLDNPQSIINQTQQFENQRKEFYIYSQQEQSFEKYQDIFGLKLLQNQDGNLYLKDVQINKNYFKQMKLQKCVNQVLDSQYSFDAQKNLISKKNSLQQIKITENNKESVKQFLNDICAANILSSSFVAGDQPTFLTIHISSLPLLKQNVSESEFELSMEILSLIIKNVSFFYICFQFYKKGYQKF
ncbi:hypothetical protein IMG5_166880, partial [Ichthyophthirius multifiliis]